MVSQLLGASLPLAFALAYFIGFIYLWYSTCKRRLRMERIRIRLSMMLHIGWVTYLVRILIALSVLLNVILGGRLNQTFSARTGNGNGTERLI